MRHKQAELTLVTTEEGTMADQSQYWAGKTATRRAALRAAAAGGGGAAALSFLAACGRGGGKQTTDTSPVAGAQATQEALDPTKGKHGGKIVIQQYGDPGAGLELLKVNNAGVHQMAGFTHDGLLEHRSGTPAFDGYDLQPQPNLAQAMPEQPDPQTYVYKLRPAKFHNGRPLTSEDVKWSYEKYAFDSPWKNQWPWLEKVETPDPQTAIVRTKYVFADALIAMVARYSATILAKEHEESPEHERRLMGTGPWLFVEYTPPSGSKYKRNPEYHRQPYPYFDEVVFLGTSDPEKKIADFSSRQTHITYYFTAEAGERVRKARPDAQLWKYVNGDGGLYFRTDKPPWNDKRVRQALSMAIDRKAYAQAITNGTGEPDQALSIAGKYWGFRKPSEMGAAAKYWDYNVAEAKKLLAAAGVSLPFEATMPHWNNTVIGQSHVDAAVLIQSQWRSAGIANIKDEEQTFAQTVTTITAGNFDSLFWFPNTLSYDPILGLNVKLRFWSPPEGVTIPTQNYGHINNPQLSALVDKQLGQLVKEERMQTFRAIEDILAEEQYILAGCTNTRYWFGDPAVKNAQSARDNYNGAIPGPKYWWFQDGKAPS
jgi:ABC-type transport system substrate-binding protein